jgi:hypothetical protein
LLHTPITPAPATSARALTPLDRLDALCEALEPSRDGPDLIGDHDAFDDALLPLIRALRINFETLRRAATPVWEMVA